MPSAEVRDLQPQGPGGEGAGQWCTRGKAVVPRTLAVLVLGGALAHASCDPANDPDRTDIANARADVAAHCDCSGFTTHGQYVRCSAQIVNTRVESGQLSRPCKGLVQKDAARSTCGKPAAITCCSAPRAGETTCRIKRTEGPCSGGTACAGGCPSWRGACTPTGCVPP